MVRNVVESLPPTIVGVLLDNRRIVKCSENGSRHPVPKGRSKRGEGRNQGRQPSESGAQVDRFLRTLLLARKLEVGTQGQEMVVVRGRRCTEEALRIKEKPGQELSGLWHIRTRDECYFTGKKSFLRFSKFVVRYPCISNHCGESEDCTRYLLSAFL